MAKQKVKRLLVGIAYDGEALVLLPKEGGYDLPTVFKKGWKKRCLIKGLEELGFEGVELHFDLAEMPAEIGGEKVLLLPFIFTYESKSPATKALPVFPKPEEVPELASLFMWRADIYAPLYMGMERTVPLLEPEAKKVQKERECLHSHIRAVGKKNYEEFCQLCDSASSMRRINEAFVALCNENHINPNRPIPEEGKKKAGDKR